MHPEMQHAEEVAWAAEGHRDAMGALFSDWRLARFHAVGRVMRDADGRQLFMSHAEWLAKYGSAITIPAALAQQELFHDH